MRASTVKPSTAIAWHKQYCMKGKKLDEKTKTMAALMLAITSLLPLKALAQEAYSEEADEPTTTVGVGAVCDQHLKIAGVCWALTRDELMNVLSSKGFQCKPSGMISFTMNPEFTCIKNSDNALALIYEKKVAFDCVNFNTCGYNVVQTAQMIIDNGLVNEMHPEFPVLEDGTQVTTYCGLASDGQKVCVTDFPILMTMRRPVFVFLDGQNFGQGEVRFD